MDGSPVSLHDFPISNWSGMEVYFDDNTDEIATFDGFTISYQHSFSGHPRPHSVADLQYSPRKPGLYDHSGSRSEAPIGFDQIELWPRQYGSASLSEEALSSLPDELQEEIAIERMPSDLISN